MKISDKNILRLKKTAIACCALFQCYTLYRTNEAIDKKENVLSSTAVAILAGACLGSALGSYSSDPRRKRSRD
jgi:hypothetical protein